MPELNQTLRLTDAEPPEPPESPLPADAPDALIPITAQPVVPTGNLSRVVEQVQSRLEKRKDSARKSPPASPGVSRTASKTSSTPEQLKARFRQFREQEAALKVEKLALQSRFLAVEQEELHLRDKSIALQNALSAFDAQTQKLRAEEAHLNRRSEELRAATEELAKERQQIQQERQHARHELHQLRQQLDRDRSAHIASVADLANARALTTTTEPARDPQISPQATPNACASASPATLPSSASPSSPLAPALIFLALTAIAALAVTLTWLTVPPVYRASATLASAAPFAPDPATHFDGPILQDALTFLRQRGLQPFNDTAPFADHLSRHLSLTPGTPGNTTTNPGTLTLTYESPHREQAIFILEALTRAYVKAHAEEGATITHAAAADLFPILDDRPRTALIAFALGTAALALITALARAATRRRTTGK